MTADKTRFLRTSSAVLIITVVIRCLVVAREQHESNVYNIISFIKKGGERERKKLSDDRET